MKCFMRIIIYSLCLGILFPALISGQGLSQFQGTWGLQTEQSSDLTPWDSVAVTIQIDGWTHLDLVTIRNPDRHPLKDSLNIQMGGVKNILPMQSMKRWKEQPVMGVFIEKGTERIVTGTWSGQGDTLHVQSRYVAQTSQGERMITIDQRYTLSSDADTLRMVEQRSTRPTELVYVFTRHEQPE